MESSQPIAWTSDASLPPIVLYPEPPPAADYIPHFPPREQLRATNQSILAMGRELSKAGIDIASGLGMSHLLMYIAIAENPCGSAAALSERRFISHKSVGATKTRLLDRLCDLATNEYTQKSGGLSESGKPHSHAAPTEERRTIGVAREYGTNVDAVRALNNVLTSHGIVPRALLPPTTAAVYDKIIESDRRVLAELAPELGISDPAYVSKYCMRILHKLSPHLPFGVELPPILIPARPEEPAGTLETADSKFVLQPRDQLKTSSQNILAIGRQLVGHGIDVGELLPVPMARAYALINLYPDDSNKQFSQRFGLALSSTIHAKKRLLDRLYVIYTTHELLFASYQEEHTALDTVGRDIGSLLLEHLLGRFARRCKLDDDVLKRFIRGEAVLPPASLDIIMSRLKIPSKQAETFRKQYKQERAQR